MVNRGGETDCRAVIRAPPCWPVAPVMIMFLRVMASDVDVMLM